MQEIELEREGLPPSCHPAPPLRHPEFISGSQAKMTKRFRLGADFGKCAVRGTSPERISEENDVFPNSQKSKRGRNDGLLTGFFARWAQNDVPANVGQPGKAAMPPQNDEHPLRHPVLDTGSVNVCKKPRFFARTSRAQNDALAKAAFTLAEVLITLGIIGVVAAMTLPALIQGQQKKALETALHKNYSIISQALEQMNFDRGEIINKASVGAEFNEDFMKYFKTAKDCKRNSCIRGESVDNADGSVTSYITKHYKNYNNTSYAGSDILDDGQFMIGDGSMVFIENYTLGGTTTGELLISVDVNGLSKGPNRLGYDVFCFQVANNGKLVPSGAEGTRYSLCSVSSNNKYNGFGCTYRALTDKTYWKDLPK